MDNFEKYLPTNCPNCGGVLKDVCCPFRKTEVVVKNTLDISEHGICDIVLRYNDGKKITMVPLHGYVSSISVSPSYIDAPILDNHLLNFSRPTEVEFNFIGEIIERR